MPTWYAFNSTPDAEVASLSIFDEIGYWGVTAKDFIAELKGVSAKTLNVELNTPGGSVFDGVAIYNALRNSGKTVNVKVLGVAASIGSLIAMAGDTIEMPENTFMMVHNPWGYAMGNAVEMRDYADFLDKIGDSLVATYMKRTGKSEDEIKALLADETWMTAAEAKELGFADVVSDAAVASAKFDPSRLPDNVRAIFDSAKPKIQLPKAAVQEPAPAAPISEPAALPAPAVPFAEQVGALAVAAGFEAFAAQWALEFTSVEPVAARIAEAREIAALCALSKRPDDSDKLIKSGKTVAQAREHLVGAMALADEKTAIDTTLMSSTQQTIHDAHPSAAFSTGAIWDARRKKQGVEA